MRAFFNRILTDLGAVVGTLILKVIRSAAEVGRAPVPGPTMRRPLPRALRPSIPAEPQEVTCDAIDFAGFIAQWQHLGVHHVDGAIFIGPRDAGGPPYVHYLFPALAEAEIDEIEALIGIRLHPSLRHFYKKFNGLNLFRGHLVVYGLRKSYDRRDLWAMMMNPFDVILPTLMAKDEIGPDFVCFSQDRDGIRMCMDGGGRVTSFTKSGEQVSEWDSFAAWFEAEAERVKAMAEQARP